MTDLALEVLKGIHTELRGVNTRLERMDERFERIDGRLERIDGRLERMDERFERIDGRLERIDGRLERIDGGVDRMDGRLGVVETGLAEVARRQTSMEMRVATEIVAVVGAIHQLRDALVADRDVRQKVQDHELRLVRLERRRS